MIVLLVIIALAVLVIIIFSFPRFSPIPYFPSNGKDLPLILKALRLRNNQTIIDLGAGDGIVIFNAAQKTYQNKLNTQFVAVEINPILLLILHLRRLYHPNRKNIKIVNKNMFSCVYSDFINVKTLDFTTFYIYISPWFIEKTVRNITKQINSFEIVSYFYQVKCLPEYTEKMKNGIHKIYRYTNQMARVKGTRSHFVLRTTRDKAALGGPALRSFSEGGGNCE